MDYSIHDAIEAGFNKVVFIIRKDIEGEFKKIIGDRIASICAEHSVSVSYAFISTVVSEWLGGFDGLGVYMIQSKKLFQYDTMFAIIVLISAISLLGMFLVDQLERTILKWKKD